MAVVTPILNLSRIPRRQLVKNKETLSEFINILPKSVTIAARPDQFTNEVGKDDDLKNALSGHAILLALAPDAKIETDPDADAPTGEQWWNHHRDHYISVISKAVKAIDKKLGWSIDGIWLNSDYLTGPLLSAIANSEVTWVFNSAFESNTWGCPLRFLNTTCIKTHIELVDILEKGEHLEEILDFAEAKVVEADAVLVTVAITLNSVKQIHDYTEHIKLFNKVLRHCKSHLEVFLGEHRQVDEPFEVKSKDIQIIINSMNPCLNLVVLDKHCLSLSDMFQVLIWAFWQNEENGKLPKTLTINSCLGPLNSEAPLQAVQVERQQLVEACENTDAFINANGYIPNRLQVGDYQVSPSAFMLTLANHMNSEDKILAIPEGPLPNYYVTHKSFRELFEILSDAEHDHYSSFASGNMAGQCWTAKEWDV